MTGTLWKGETDGRKGPIRAAWLQLKILHYQLLHFTWFKKKIFINIIGVWDSKFRKTNPIINVHGTGIKTADHGIGPVWTGVALAAWCLQIYSVHWLQIFSRWQYCRLFNKCACAIWSLSYSCFNPQNIIVVSCVVCSKCNIFVWILGGTMNTKSALLWWILMTWCFSTKTNSHVLFHTLLGFSVIQVEPNWGDDSSPIKYSPQPWHKAPPSTRTQLTNSTGSFSTTLHCHY